MQGTNSLPLYAVFRKCASMKSRPLSAKRLLSESLTRLQAKLHIKYVGQRMVKYLHHYQM